MLYNKPPLPKFLKLKTETYLTKAIPTPKNQPHRIKPYRNNVPTRQRNLPRKTKTPHKKISIQTAD